MPNWAFWITRITIFVEYQMGIKERSVIRRRRIVAYRAANFEEAEKWDLDFWQSQTPEQRLSALVSIRRDVAKVEQARLQTTDDAKGTS